MEIDVDALDMSLVKRLMGFPWKDARCRDAAANILTVCRNYAAHNEEGAEGEYQRALSMITKIQAYDDGHSCKHC